MQCLALASSVLTLNYLRSAADLAMKQAVYYDKKEVNNEELIEKVLQTTKFLSQEQFVGL
jgi:hypothetical protein